MQEKKEESSGLEFSYPTELLLSKTEHRANLERLLRKALPFVQAARGSNEFIKEIETALESKDDGHNSEHN